MNPAITSPLDTAPSAGWQRLHQALMPDYNRKAALYWWSVVLLGLVVLAHSLQQLAALPLSAWLQIIVGTALAMVAGLVPVRIPRSTNSFTAGEIFIFLLLLLHGPAAAALAAAGEGLVGALRTSRAGSASPPVPELARAAAAADERRLAHPRPHDAVSETDDGTRR